MNGIIKFGLVNVSLIMVAAGCAPPSSSESQNPSVPSNVRIVEWDVPDQEAVGGDGTMWAHVKTHYTMTITEAESGVYEAARESVGKFTTIEGATTPSLKDDGYAVFTHPVTGDFTEKWTGGFTAPPSYSTFNSEPTIESDGTGSSIEALFSGTNGSLDNYPGTLSSDYKRGSQCYCYTSGVDGPTGNIINKPQPVTGGRTIPRTGF
jgi:hypothetical protein